MSVNKMIILGRLGQDPELRYSKEQMPICEISLATDYNHETEWHRVVLFKTLAELASKYLVKGNQVYIEGRVKTSTYEKDGVKKYSRKVIATNITLLDNKKEGGTSSSNQPEKQWKGDKDADYFGDDIPF